GGVLFLPGLVLACSVFFVIFSAPASAEIYTLSLHDALPISEVFGLGMGVLTEGRAADITVIDLGKQYVLDKNEFCSKARNTPFQDRKSTRLNSSHVSISYAVFCLKKKNK